MLHTIYIYPYKYCKIQVVRDNFNYEIHPSLQEYIIDTLNVYYLCSKYFYNCLVTIFVKSVGIDQFVTVLLLIIIEILEWCHFESYPKYIKSSLKVSLLTTRPQCKVTHISITCRCSMYCCYLQVAAQTGHSVVLVDQTDTILQKAKERIDTSLKRVANKQHPDDAKVRS